MKLVHTRKLFKALRGLGSGMANEFRSLGRSQSRGRSVSVNSKRKGGEAAAELEKWKRNRAWVEMKRRRDEGELPEPPPRYSRWTVASAVTMYETKQLKASIEHKSLEGRKVSGWGVYCYDFLLLPITSYCS